MIDSIVKYTHEKSTSTGIVLDKIIMKNATNDPTVVSGYLVKSLVSSKLKSIQHWRIVEVIESIEEKAEKGFIEASKSPFDKNNNVFEAMGVERNQPTTNLFEEDEEDDLPF